ncbi:MAG: homoserine dehydrogenase [Tenericutes bacterium]|nr:homoserine dehydrogenase [Mycoplasmatota bacterium]
MKIAIIGLGVVGRGVYDLVTMDQSVLQVKYVLELDKSKLQGIDALVAKDIDEILNDSEVDTVVELIGGKGIAYSFVLQALNHKKNVVTANKALISAYFKELTELANKNNVSLRYEAAVGGAINILDPLLTISRINKIHKIQGIINGSSNFILSKIFIEDYSLEKALEEAFKLGYLEANSNDDMEGLDLLRKINILSMLSYHQYIDESDIIRVPLSNVSSAFIDYIKSKNLALKYIATSELVNNQIMIHLEPVVIKKDSFYSYINYEENIIDIYGQYHLKQSFIGQGAGRYPTASAVVYDLIKQTEKTDYIQSFENNYPINKELKKYPFFILKNGLIEKTEYLSYASLQKTGALILARIEDDVYEEI